MEWTEARGLRLPRLGSAKADSLEGGRRSYIYTYSIYIAYIQLPMTLDFHVSLLILFTSTSQIGISSHHLPMNMESHGAIASDFKALTPDFSARVLNVSEPVHHWIRSFPCLSLPQERYRGHVALSD